MSLTASLALASPTPVASPSPTPFLAVVDMNGMKKALDSLKTYSISSRDEAIANGTHVACKCDDTLDEKIPCQYFKAPGGAEVCWPEGGKGITHNDFEAIACFLKRYAYSDEKCINVKEIDCGKYDSVIGSLVKDWHTCIDYSLLGITFPSDDDGDEDNQGCESIAWKYFDSFRTLLREMRKLPEGTFTLRKNSMMDIVPFRVADKPYPGSKSNHSLLQLWGRDYAAC